MDTVPILAGSNRHAGDGEVFVQLIKGSGKTAAACRDNRSADFHGLVKVCAVEQPVKKSNKCCICRCIINRTSDNKAVSLFKFRSNLIYHIGKSTFSELGTGTAGNTAADIFISDMYDFRLNTIFCKDFFHFVQGSISAAFCVRTSVD